MPQRDEAEHALNLLAISIGNSRTRLGTFLDGKLIESQAIDNSNGAAFAGAIDEAFAPLRSHDDTAILLASVNPAMEEGIRSHLGKQTNKPVWRVDKDLPIPVGRQLDPETLVGDDRLLNAAAAYDTLKQACIIVDAGTAMTVDLVDGAGTFHGGAICPGAQMMLNALHGRAAQLPELELTPPRGAIGHSTTEAMLSGIFHGVRGMVRELTEQFAEQIGTYPTVIATGGDADLVFGHYELVDRVVPELTMMGMLVTLRTSVEHPTDG